MIEPAGASALALAEAIFAGSSPIVRVKEALCVPSVTVTVLSPERSAAGVQDQLPELLAVAEIDSVPTVPVTVAPAVVIPDKVGLGEVNQNCLAPCGKVTPPTEETRPDPARTVTGNKQKATSVKRKAISVSRIALSDIKAGFIFTSNLSIPINFGKCKNWLVGL